MRIVPRRRDLDLLGMRDAQGTQLGEIGRPQIPGMVHLAEHHVLRRTAGDPPMVYAPFKRSDRMESNADTLIFALIFGGLRRRRGLVEGARRDQAGCLGRRNAGGMAGAALSRRVSTAVSERPQRKPPQERFSARRLSAVQHCAGRKCTRDSHTAVR